MNDPAVKTGAAVFVTILDIAMQIIVLARAKQYWSIGAWKREQWKKKLIAFLLFAFYAVYLVFYAILSAVGFFMVEVEKTTAEIKTIQEVRTNNQSRIDTIDGELKALNVQLATEGKTGFGGNSRTIIERKEKLEAERVGLETANRKSLTVKQEAIKSAVNSFEVLSGKLGVKQENLETLVVGIAVIALYVFIILLTEEDITKKPAPILNGNTGKVLNPDPDTIPNPLPGQKPEEVLNLFPDPDPETNINIPQPYNNYFEPQTETRTEKNGKKVCPICGKAFPFKHDDKIFCGSACRSKSHRTREGVVCHGTN
jgi:ribosomal protein S27AE